MRSSLLRSGCCLHIERVNNSAHTLLPWFISTRRLHLVLLQYSILTTAICFQHLTVSSVRCTLAASARRHDCLPLDMHHRHNSKLTLSTWPPTFSSRNFLSTFLFQHSLPSSALSMCFVLVSHPTQA